MDKEKMIAEITAGIERIIDWNVKQINEDNSRYERLYKSCIEDINIEIKSSKESIKYFNDNELSFNKIEQEGFLRGLIYIRDLFKENEGYE